MVQAQILPKISGGKKLTIRVSFNILFKSEETIHATPHVTNLIRNGASEL
jgi:hypothetical protein